MARRKKKIMTKPIFLQDTQRLSSLYRAGALPSGWYRFFCGAEHIGYLTNDEDDEKEIEARRQKDVTIIYDPYMFYERQKGTQYITADNHVFIGRLNYLTIIEKLSGKPKNDLKN